MAKPTLTKSRWTREKEHIYLISLTWHWDFMREMIQRSKQTMYHVRSLDEEQIVVKKSDWIKGWEPVGMNWTNLGLSVSSYYASWPCIFRNMGVPFLRVWWTSPHFRTIWLDSGERPEKMTVWLSCFCQLLRFLQLEVFSMPRCLMLE